MQNYSIRKLHLLNDAMIAAEIGIEDSPKFQAFNHLYRNYPIALKIISRGGEIPPSLPASWSLCRIACWMLDSNKAILFGSEESLQNCARQKNIGSSAEQIFQECLKKFLLRQSKTSFEMASEQYMFNFGGYTRIMGILNVTPDSFFDRGRYATKKAAVDRGIMMEFEGADIIDVGGESTRPGAAPVSEADEMARVIPVIEELANEIQIPICIDTTKASVAEAAIQAGATIVNDVSGLRADPHMAEVVAHYDVPVVVMHMQGTPGDMQNNPTYENLIDTIYMFFEDRLEAATAAGISPDRIIIDPGIGFGKGLWDNYEILQRLMEFRGLGCPILVGPSRKSFIGKVLDLPPEERLEGTAAAVAASAAAKCQIVRVHDVKEMLRVVQISDLVFGNIDFRQQS